MGVVLSKLPELNLETGKMDDAPIPFLLGAAKIWAVTGVLSVEQNKINKKIYLLEGLPVYCQSDLSGESLRQVMIKLGKMDNDALKKVEQMMSRENIEEDQAMLQLGIFDESDRYFHLQDQARKRILSLFGWANGFYMFEPSEDFLDKTDLFDMDPLEIIHEGMTSHNTLDVAKIMLDAASETVVFSDRFHDLKPFIEKHYPDAKPITPDSDGAPLGSIIPLLHPDIRQSLNLAFALVAAGGLLIDGKRPCELNPPPAQGVELEDDISEETTYSAPDDAAFDNPWAGEAQSPNLDDEDEIPPEQPPASASKTASNDPWKGAVESPNLDVDEDIPDILTEPVAPPPARKISAAPKAEPPKPAAPPRKITAPPPEPPWKKKTPHISLGPIFNKQDSKPTATKPPAPQPHLQKPTPQPLKTAPRGAAPRPPTVLQKPIAVKADTKEEKSLVDMLELARKGNPFELLKVDIETDRAEIKKAFFHLHTQYKPEKAASLGPEGKRISEEIQKALKTAHDTLLDTKMRYEAETRVAAEEKVKAWSIELRKELAKRQFRRGKWYLSQHQPDMAFAFFDSAANLDADQAPYYAYLGWAQYSAKRGAAAESVSFIRTALGINPKSSEAYLFMGWILKGTGDEKNAIVCFQKAAEFDPNNSFARQELADAKKQESGLLKRFFGK